MVWPFSSYTSCFNRVHKSDINTLLERFTTCRLVFCFGSFPNRSKTSAPPGNIPKHQWRQAFLRLQDPAEQTSTC